MGNLLKKHPALIFALLLGWLTYGSFDTEAQQAKGAQQPDSIDRVVLATRAQGVRAERLSSPFQPGLEPPTPGTASALPPLGAWLVDPLVSARSAASTVTPGRLGPHDLMGTLLLRCRLPAVAGLTVVGRASGLLRGARLPDSGNQPSFELALESALAFSRGGGRARINGRDVIVGDELPGFDPVSPPVLLDVSGTTVTIEHRGLEVVLDLDTRRKALFGPQPPGR